MGKCAYLVIFYSTCKICGVKLHVGKLKYLCSMLPDMLMVDVCKPANLGEPFLFLGAEQRFISAVAPRWFNAMRINAY